MKIEYSEVSGTGIMECWASGEALALSWNDGFKENSIRNGYNLIDFLVLREYFSGKNHKIYAWRASSKKVGSAFLVR